MDSLQVTSILVITPIKKVVAKMVTNKKINSTLTKTLSRPIGIYLILIEIPISA